MGRREDKKDHNFADIIQASSQLPKPTQKWLFFFYKSQNLYLNQEVNIDKTISITQIEAFNKFTKKLIDFSTEGGFQTYGKIGQQVWELFVQQNFISIPPRFDAIS